MSYPTESDLIMAQGPKTLEEFIASFDLPRQKELRIAFQQFHNLMSSWTPETRGDKCLVVYLALQRGIGASLEDKPFTPSEGVKA